MVVLFLISIQEDIYLPLEVGNRWEYGDYAVVILRDTVIGDTVCYGYSTLPYVDSIPDWVWDSASVWRHPMNNWLCRCGSGDSSLYFIADTLGGEGMVLISNPLRLDKKWEVKIENISRKDPVMAMVVGTENVNVEEFSYENCWVIKKEFYRYDAFRDIEYHIINYTWVKDSVGIVKDSIAIPEIEKIKVVRLAKYKIQQEE